MDTNKDKNAIDSDEQNKCVTITKNGHSFNVVGSQSIDWFTYNFNEGNWEPNTFRIISKFCGNTYLDIGSWIGPTALYAAKFYKKVYCFEPDPLANEQLLNNLKVNKFDNITLIPKALNTHNDKQELAMIDLPYSSSSSSLVFDKKKYANYVDGLGHTIKTIQVDSITLDTFIDQYKVDPHKISLIKIDIEGAEIKLIPAIQTFLYKYKPPLFISLHWIFLERDDLIPILNILFNVYKFCYHNFKNINLADILKTQAPELLFVSKAQKF